MLRTGEIAIIIEEDELPQCVTAPHPHHPHQYQYHQYPESRSSASWLPPMSTSRSSCPSPMTAVIAAAKKDRVHSLSHSASSSPRTKSSSHYRTKNSRKMQARVSLPTAAAAAPSPQAPLVGPLPPSSSGILEFGYPMDQVLGKLEKSMKRSRSLARSAICQEAMRVNAMLLQSQQQQQHQQEQEQEQRYSPEQPQDYSTQEPLRLQDPDEQEGGQSSSTHNRKQCRRVSLAMPLGKRRKLSSPEDSHQEEDSDDTNTKNPLSNEDNAIERPNPPVSSKAAEATVSCTPTTNSTQATAGNESTDGSHSDATKMDVKDNNKDDDDKSPTPTTACSEPKEDARSEPKDNAATTTQDSAPCFVHAPTTTTPLTHQAMVPSSCSSADDNLLYHQAARSCRMIRLLKKLETIQGELLDALMASVDDAEMRQDSLQQQQQPQSFLSWE